MTDTPKVKVMPSYKLPRHMDGLFVYSGGIRAGGYCRPSINRFGSAKVRARAGHDYPIQGTDKGRTTEWTAPGHKREYPDRDTTRINTGLIFKTDQVVGRKSRKAHKTSSLCRQVAPDLVAYRVLSGKR